MVKNVIIDLPEEIVEEARANAYESGRSLKDVVEKAILDVSKAPPNRRWVVEKALRDFAWAPTRVTLFNMRRSGRLSEGKHYKRKGKYIYYNRKKLEKMFKEEQCRKELKMIIP